MRSLAGLAWLLLPVGLLGAETGRMVGWGWSADPHAALVPTNFVDVVSVAPGQWHGCALRANGEVVVWDGSFLVDFTPPQGLTNITAIASGTHHSLAVRSDGSVINWGQFTNVPAGLFQVVQVAGGLGFSLALEADGRVTAWTAPYFSEVPPQAVVPSEATNVIQIAAGGYHGLALRADGSLVVWGDNDFGQTEVPPDLGDVTGMAAGAYHSVALKADGTVVCWGSNLNGQCAVPPGLSNVVAVAAGNAHTIALTADRGVVAWGSGAEEHVNLPADYRDVIQIATGGSYNVALLRVVERPLVETSIRLNFGSGLFEQTISYRNSGTSSLAGIRILVRDLPVDVILYNQSGQVEGIPFVEHRLTLAPEETVRFRLEFHRPSRLLFGYPNYEAVPIGMGSSILVGEEPFAIDRVVKASADTFMIEFQSVPDMRYFIEYSDDLQTWKQSPTIVAPAANRVQWFDSGPPHTEASPLIRGTRYYRVRRLLE